MPIINLLSRIVTSATKAKDSLVHKRFFSYGRNSAQFIIFSASCINNNNKRFATQIKPAKSNNNPVNANRTSTKERLNWMEAVYNSMPAWDDASGRFMGLGLWHPCVELVFRYAVSNITRYIARGVADALAFVNLVAARHLLITFSSRKN